MAGFELDITEQKRTEDALKLSIERFDLAVQGSRDGLWDLHFSADDPLNVANLTYYSPRMKEIMGVKGEDGPDLLGTWVTLLHPDDRERVFAAVHAHLARRIPYDIEYRIVRKDGVCRWIAARGQAQWNETGDPIRMSGSFSDITERKQAEEALCESEVRSRSIIETAFDAVIATNKEGRIIGWNAQAEAIFGYSAHEAIGRGLSETIIPVRFRQAHAIGIARVFQAGENPGSKGRREFSALHRDGHEFPVELAITLFHVNGQPVLSAFVRDITERKQAEEALRESEERYRLLTAATFDGIAIHDQGIILEVNPGLERMFGYGPGELLGKHVLDLVADESRETVLAKMRNNEQGPYESVGRRKDGSTFYGEVIIKPCRYNGRDVRLVAGRDITARKQTEQALRQTADRLSLATRAGGVGIWDWDVASNVLTWDDQMFALYGVSRESFTCTYEGWKACVCPGDVEQADAEVQRALRGEKDLDIEFRVLWPNGTIRNIRALTTVHRDVSGHPLRMIGTNWDITERKRMEEALRQREHDLRTAIEERARISQDLHDGILQSLFAVGLGLEASHALLSPGSRKVAGPRLDQAIGELNRVIREVRSFIAGLAPDPLQGKDLLPALRLMLKSLTQNHALRVRLVAEDRAAQAVSAEQAAHMIYIAQEAVSNCLQHSGAQEAMVSLKLLKQGVRLSIRDKGCGFNPASVKGHGLINMTDRAQKIGGRCTVFSKINEGTRVVLDLPKEVLSVRC